MKSYIKSLKNIDTLILSLDTLVYGGLIPSRRTEESFEDLQKRCKVSQTIIDKMRMMGILDGMPESSQMTLNLF